MTDHPAQDELRILLDGTRPAAQFDTLTRHVHDCPTCQAALEALRAGPPSSRFGALTTLVQAPSGTAAPPDPGETLPPQPVLATRRRNAPLPAIAGYELLGELGRGGMGVVYKARHVQLNRLVALKTILPGRHDDGDLARFRWEAEAVARLRHPNVVQVHEVGRHGEQYYFSLEYVEGGTLADRLEGGPLDARDAARLVAAVARGVHAAHQAGIIHRDLKPANVLLASGGCEPPGNKEHNENEEPGGSHPPLADAVPKVADFGLAKRLEGDSHLTQTGLILGTPSYMAPEQADTRGVVGTPADVYGLGAILYACLTGVPPFQGYDPFTIVGQVLKDAPTPPRHLNAAVDRGLEAICLKCLEKDPALRYGSADALADDLDRWLAGAPLVAQPPALLTQVRHWLRQNFGAFGWTVPIGLTYGVVGGLMAALWGEQGMVTAGARLYAEVFPSAPRPWLAWLASGPTGLLYTVILLTVAAVLVTSGLATAVLVRPKSRAADWAVGLTMALFGTITTYACGVGWLVTTSMMLLPGRADLRQLGDAAVLLSPGESAPPAAGGPTLLDLYPDLASQPPADRGRQVMAKTLYDLNYRAAVCGFVGLLYAAAIAMPFLVFGVCLAGPLWRRHGFGRALLPYLERALPLALFLMDMWTLALTLALMSPWSTDRPWRLALLDALFLLAAVAAIRDWLWPVRRVLQVAALGVMLMV